MSTTRGPDGGQARPPADVKSLSEHLVKHYRREAELYKSILKLTELQHANLGQSDDIRDFITLLRQKEDLIRAIDRIELQVEDEKETWLGIPEGEKADSNRDLNAVLDTIIDLIERIMRVERENEEFLRTRKDEVERQLEAIRQGCGAAKECKPKPDAKVINAIS